MYNSISDSDAAIERAQRSLDVIEARSAALAALFDGKRPDVDSCHFMLENLARTAVEECRTARQNLQDAVEAHHQRDSAREIIENLHDECIDDVNQALDIRSDCNHFIDMAKMRSRYYFQENQVVFRHAAHRSANVIQCAFRVHRACNAINERRMQNIADHFRRRREAAVTIQIAWHNHMDREAQAFFERTNFFWTRPDGTTASCCICELPNLVRIQACIRRWLVNLNDDDKTVLYSPHQPESPSFSPDSPAFQEPEWLPHIPNAPPPSPAYTPISPTFTPVSPAFTPVSPKSPDHAKGKAAGMVLQPQQYRRPLQPLPAPASPPSPIVLPTTRHRAARTIQHAWKCRVFHIDHDGNTVPLGLKRLRDQRERLKFQQHRPPPINTQRPTRPTPPTRRMRLLANGGRGPEATVTVTGNAPPPPIVFALARTLLECVVDTRVVQTRANNRAADVAKRAANAATAAASTAQAIVTAAQAAKAAQDAVVNAQTSILSVKRERALWREATGPAMNTRAKRAKLAREWNE